MLCVLLFALAARALPVAAPKPVSLAEADKLFVEKSYAGALQGYEAALKAGTVPAARKDEVQYRVAVSLGKSQQWERALATGLEFVKTHRETVWEPRGLYWLGRLYIGVPHYGWQVGKKTVRGNDVPHAAGDERPERVYLAEQDQQNARDALEAARVYYARYRAERKTEDEEIQLDFDLARVLQGDPKFYEWASKQAWAAPEDPTWAPDSGQAYALDWPTPKKIHYLYTQIRSLAKEKQEPERAALSLFGEALWLRRYHGMMAQYAVKWEALPDGTSKSTLLPYPYQDREPEAVLKQLIKEYPESKVRDQAQFTLGSMLEGSSKFTEAVAAWRLFLEERPQSKWTEDAKFRIQQIELRSVGLNSSGTEPPGQNGHVYVTYRNVKTVHFEAFRVKLEDVLTRPERLNDPQTHWTEFEKNFGHAKDVAAKYGPPVAKWDFDTKDKGDHQHGSETVEVPVKQAGAYVLLATAPGVHVATVLLLTDMVAVQQLHRDGALYFVTDGASGKPAEGAEVVVKQWWYENGTYRTTSTRGKTNADGLYSAALERRPSRTNFQAAALIHQGNRYAVTGEGYTWDQQDNPDLFKVYSVTDRSVYRPAQVVKYRQIVLRRQRGELKPVAQKQVKVEVYDPQGKSVYTATQLSSEFGTVHGEFPISSGAPLGEYQVRVSVPAEANGPTQFGGNRFRVEEYKKPEYLVEVKPAANRVRLGQPTSAVVKASYYFGGPVPGAKVSYRVYRNYWAQGYQFPRPFDFLYRYSNNGNYDTYYRNGTVVSQGEAKTDAKGEAKITFPTEVKEPQWRNYDFTYTVEADVQDASRRVISGDGAVKATRHDVAAFLDYPHGYASKGDMVNVEIRTLNPSDQPVAVAGTAKVFRWPETPKAKEKLVHEEPLKTDTHGRAILHWKATEGGHFRIAFATKDTAGEAVEGSTYVWVQGPELDQGRFHMDQIALKVENPYYEEGQTAKALLVATEPGCTVLLTRMANNEILEKQVVRLKGRSMELKLPLTRRDVPNVYLSAVMIRDGRMYQATEELFVPPVRQFNTVTVTAEKQQYQPGEKARFQIHAADWQGRPLRTELSVSVSDAALGSIQKDYAPDIRLYYYGDRRSQSIQSTGSPGTGFQHGYDDTQPRQEFRVHQWVLPEGMGQIEDWPGKSDEGRNFLSRYRYADENGYFYDYYGYGRGAGGLGGGGFEDGLRGPKGDMAMAKSLPAAAPAAPMSRTASVAFNRRDEAEKDKKSEIAAEPAARSRFQDTAFWTPAVVTDVAGNASVQVTWPDNLTQWRANSVGTTATGQVGSGETRVRTKKDLIVRMQAPRFFVERDHLMLTANVHNYLPKAARVKVAMRLEGDTAELSPWHARSHEDLYHAEQSIEIPRDGEKRVDWPVQITHDGSLRVRMTAQTQGASDGAEMSFPVLVHGAERQVAQSGVIRQQNREQIAIHLPKERKPGSSELIVQLNPSLGATMVDALPYLADYPYGCIEQTMSRFLPTVVVAKTLQDLGYDLTALKRRAAELRERERVGDKARPGDKIDANSPYTYPKGRPGGIRAEVLSQHLLRAYNPVFDPDQLKSMVTEGLGRIRGFQHSDGGWGWWPADSSDPYMTCYVLYGLMTCRDAGYAVEPQMVDRGLEFLSKAFLEDDNFHRMAYEARVLGMDPRYRQRIKALTTGRLYENRERLSALSKALLALALHEVGDASKAETLLRNLETTAKVDRGNGTANWGEGRDYWWYWWNNKVETNATVLQAYMAIRPQAELPPMMVKWLVNNRRGNTWYSTRDTAMAVYALADYIRVNKELAPEYTLTVDLGGRVQRSYTVTKENAFFFDNQFVVPDALLQTGDQTLTLTKNGPGALYFSAFTQYFSLEEPIKSTGNEIFVHRKYFRLIPGTASGTPEAVALDRDRENPFITGHYELLEAGGVYTAGGDTQGGPRYERRAMTDGETVTSGDQIEVELQLEAKNDYEYLVFEDLKPAGCEAVELRSGFHMGLGTCSNVEFRDQKVAFFLSHLPQGTRTLSYRLRAEIPGEFHVLPTNGYAMYAPDIRTLSDEMHVQIKDAGG